MENDAACDELIMIDFVCLLMMYDGDVWLMIDVWLMDGGWGVVMYDYDVLYMIVYDECGRCWWVMMVMVEGDWWGMLEYNGWLMLDDVGSSGMMMLLMNDDRLCWMMMGDGSMTMMFYA